MRQALAAMARLAGRSGAKGGGSLTLYEPATDPGRVFDALRPSLRIVRLLTKLQKYIIHTIAYIHFRDYA
jgi:hypothetical protein